MNQSPVGGGQIVPPAFSFNFGGALSRVFIQEQLPSPREIAGEGAGKLLLVCDRNTEALALKLGGREAACCVLPPGEDAKTWAGVEEILRFAYEAGLGRDGLFVGIGGGVITDMTAFAASVYMRGARLCLAPTTLLGMVDAALGGKTGFDLFGMKNLAGSFFPARDVYIARESLLTLPPAEWKPGMAELIKTAIIKPDGGKLLSQAKSLMPSFQAGALIADPLLMDCITQAVSVKGRIVEADPQEMGSERALLNLGHTFGHALESSLGLGRISHGEAVAWGIVRSCELGRALGITPPDRAEEISAIFHDGGYEIYAPHPLLADTSAFMRALGGDKKKRGGTLRFVVPGAEGAVLVSLSAGDVRLPELIIKGECQ